MLQPSAEGVLRYSSLGRRFLGQRATLARSKFSGVCPLCASLKEDGLNNFNIYNRSFLCIFLLYAYICIYVCVCIRLSSSSCFDCVSKSSLCASRPAAACCCVGLLVHCFSLPFRLVA